MSIVKTSNGIGLNLALVRAWSDGRDPMHNKPCVILEYGPNDTKMFTGDDRDMIAAALNYMAAQDETDRRVDAELDGIMGARRTGPETAMTGYDTWAPYHNPDPSPSKIFVPSMGLPDQIEVPEVPPEFVDFMQKTVGPALSKFARWAETLNVQAGGLPRADDPTASRKRPGR